MGKCLTIVKLVGIGSLGLTSGSYLLTSFNIIPSVVAKTTGDYSSLKEKISKLFVSLRLGFWSLGSLSSYLFYQAYAKSPAYGKHPYLIYAALAFPIALGYNYFYAFGEEQKLIKNEEEKIIYRHQKKTVKEVISPEEDTSPLDNSSYNDLGSQTPKLEEKEVDVQVPVVNKVELAEETYKSILSEVATSHLYTGAILGTGFFLSIIGYFGDNV